MAVRCDRWGTGTVPDAETGGPSSRAVQCPRRGTGSADGRGPAGRRNGGARHAPPQAQRRAEAVVVGPKMKKWRHRPEGTRKTLKF